MRHEPMQRQDELRRVEEIVSVQAMKTPERIALVQDGRHCTYGELQRAIAFGAKWLAQQGARPCDRVLLVCENSFAAVAVYFACATVGAWPVIVNARLSAREIDDIAAHCESRLMLFTTSGSSRAKAHAERRGATMLPDLAGVGAVAIGPLNGSVEQEAEADNSDGQSDVAALIYTTGTTGRPKGVMLTHTNLLFVARATAEARGLTSADRVYATLPISHALGLTGVLLGSLLSGAEVHLTSRFDPAAVLAELGNGGISVMIGTPSMYALLVEYAKRKQLVPIAAPSLRLMSSAGAPLDATTKADAEAAFGQTLHNGYGISECGPSISLTALDAPRGDCSVGRLLAGVEARLVVGANDEAGTKMGELLIRSPGVMKGYYRAPEETRAAIDDTGWFRTGDLARIDNDHLFIVGRAKEMIIRFGFNVYPAEVEAVLNAHPQVVRSVVAGHVRNGTEDILAFVQMAGGTTTAAADLADYSASRLAPYKRPTEIVVVCEMPMNANGKVLKAELVAKWMESNASAPPASAAA